MGQDSYGKLASVMSTGSESSVKDVLELGLGATGVVLYADSDIKRYSLTVELAWNKRLLYTALLVVQK